MRHRFGGPVDLIPLHKRWTVRPLCWAVGHDWIEEGDLCWEARFAHLPREHRPDALRFDEKCQRWCCLRCEQWVDNHPEPPGRFPRSRPDPFDEVYRDGRIVVRHSGEVVHDYREELPGRSSGPGSWVPVALQRRRR